MKSTDKRWQNLPAYIFYISFFIELIIVLIDKSAYINPIEGRLFQITFALFCVKILFTKYTNKEWLLILLCMLLGMISYWITGRNEVIRVVAFIAASKDISKDFTLKLTFYVITVGVALLIILSLLGVFGEVSITGEFRPGIIETRYCLGIGHPNALHCMLWTIIILGIYLYFDRITYLMYLGLFIANLGIYYLTISRTGVIITALTILISVLIKARKEIINSIWCYVLALAVLGGAVIFSLVAAKYSISLKPLEVLDRYLTGRIRWSHHYGGMSFWSLFSNPLNKEYYDMGFMRLFYWYGYIPAVVYLISICLLLWNCYTHKNIKDTLIIAMFTIYTVVEAHAISVYIPRNYILLLFVGGWMEIFLVNKGLEVSIWQLPKHLIGIESQAENKIKKM